MTEKPQKGRATLTPPPVNNRSKVGNGSKLLAGVDGRSTIARRFREIAAELMADRGGVVSEGQRAIIARAATLSVWLEDQETKLANGEEFDVGPYTTAVNTLRRLLADLGLKRDATDVTPDLSSYLADGGHQ